jgi:Holliday junction resolvasome RuvABC endonuclease subunit
MPERTFIGIDPATNCGWAVLDEGGNRVASGTWSLERRRGDGAGMLFVRFERLFRELVASYPGSVVAYEQVANHHSGSAHVGLGLISQVQRLGEELARPYTGIPPAAVKKVATGKGNANKEVVLKAARDRWGEVGDDNEADALWIADAVRTGRA